MMTPSERQLLNELPRAIWIPSPENVIYRGTPAEIVGEMMPQRLQDRPLRNKVRYLQEHFAKKRSLVIGLPDDVEDEILAGLFVFSLLSAGVARTAWTA